MRAQSTVITNQAPARQLRKSTLPGKQQASAAPANQFTLHPCQNAALGTSKNGWRTCRNRLLGFPTLKQQGPRASSYRIEPCDDHMLHLLCVKWYLWHLHVPNNRYLGKGQHLSSLTSQAAHYPSHVGAQFVTP